MPTVKDGSLPATPRRIRLRDGEILDHWMGAPFPAMLGGERIMIQKGFYVGQRTVLSHRYVMTHPHRWDRVDEPFPIEKH
jgi:hypothetical protein